MGKNSAIEWTDDTWNPIVGCSIVSPGCTNCYAMKQAARLLDGNPKSPHYAGTTKRVNGKAVWTGKVALAPDHILTAPLRWKKPRRIFVNSMGDLFHESVSDEWIDRVFAVMALGPQHTFQVLTKRSKRMREYCREIRAAYIDAQNALSERVFGHRSSTITFPLPNVWLGVSAEDQQRADERIPDLLATPAAVRFVSAEPLLKPIDLGGGLPGEYDDDLTPGLDWIIAGGESGPGARPMHPDWARSIRDQCAAAGVAFHFKQWGEWLDADTALDGLSLGEIVVDGKPWHPARPLNHHDAEIVANLRGCRFEHHSDGTTYLRLGKFRAGRILDGRTHDDFPEVMR